MITVNLRINGHKFSLEAPPEEEELLRRAETMINERIRFHGVNNKVYDKHELLLMVLIESTYHYLKVKKEDENFEKEVSLQVQQLQQSFSTFQ